MAWRYRRSYKMGPFRFNVSQKGVGWSVGNRFHRTTFTADGKIRETWTIPGTGVSHVSTRSRAASERPAKVYPRGTYLAASILCGIVTGLLALISLLAMAAGSWAVLILTVPAGLLGWLFSYGMGKKAKELEE